jgi:DNA repair ATPase RecN
MITDEQLAGIKETAEQEYLEPEQAFALIEEVERLKDTRQKEWDAAIRFAGQARERLEKIEAELNYWQALWEKASNSVLGLQADLNDYKQAAAAEAQLADEFKTEVERLRKSRRDYDVRLANAEAERDRYQKMVEIMPGPCADAVHDALGEEEES